ncbi:hypothetical protein ACV34S_22310 [Pseudomonas aeruginosa]
MRNLLQHLANLCAILSCAITVYQLLHPAAPGALPTQTPAPLYAAAVEFKGVLYRLSGLWSPDVLVLASGSGRPVGTDLT